MERKFRIKPERWRGRVFPPFTVSVSGNVKALSNTLFFGSRKEAREAKAELVKQGFRMIIQKFYNSGIEMRWEEEK